MSQTPRPDAAAAAQRVKDLARDVATDLAQGYRRSSRYFRMRIGVVTGWAVLSLVTLFASCPPSGPTNSLGATVTVLARSESLVGTQIQVANESSGNWTDVAFTLDGQWRFEKKTVRAGDKVVLSIDKFRRAGGGAPPADLKPQTLRIDAEQGHATEALVHR
jgi:hypothetical protein